MMVVARWEKDSKKEAEIFFVNQNWLNAVQATEYFVVIRNLR